MTRGKKGKRKERKGSGEGVRDGYRRGVKTPSSRMLGVHVCVCVCTSCLCMCVMGEGWTVQT